jgi:nitroimidazol reductase NimA-like FMN-containing flavoprotein (pyridoxamine 5'-phosphate oxidase superfamily)
MMVDEGLELLEDDDCFELLSLQSIGRVALTMGALPVVFPVNYKLDGRTIVFRTGPGAKLAAAANRAVIAFEVDESDPAVHSGWSVLALGVASLVDDPGELERLDRLEVSAWAGGNRQSLVKVPVEMISGRRILTSERE